jgi:branched-chain amino acid transport system ATP-binding protein
MLEIKDVHKSFGGLKAVDGCSLSVEKGSITGLIGPNGAGKTTLFNVITGHYQPDEGSILFKDQEIGGLAPHQVFGKKLYRTFQITREFAQMSVLENLLLMPEGLCRIDRSQERVCRIPFRRPEKTIGTGPQHDGRS